MLNLIRNFIAPNVGLRLIMRGNFPTMSAMTLQNIVRSYGLMGQVHLVQGSHALIVLEGPKTKLESQIARLQKTPLIDGPVVLEATWLPYKKQFNTFRVSF